MSVMQIQHGETTERGKPKEDYKFKQALKIRNLKNRLKKVLEACKSKTMELALSLEKLTNEKLLNLHEVASRNNDVQLADFVESEFLGEQVQAIKKISEYVAQLRRIGKGHGVWHFDQMLLN